MMVLEETATSAAAAAIPADTTAPPATFTLDVDRSNAADLQDGIIIVR